MKPEIKKELIKSVTAVICVASVCVTAVNSFDKIAATIKDTASPAAVQSEENVLTDEAAPVEDVLGDNSVDTDAVDDGSDIVADDTQDTPADEAEPSSENAASSDSSASASKTTTKKTSSGPQTKAEIINYCNTALNKAKSAKVGYSKKMIREVKGDTAGISQSLIKLVASNKSTTMKKGSSDIKDDFPAAGYDWSSKLRVQDVQNATIKTSGQYYEIKLTLGKEKNPAKGEASSYGRVMSVIDATEAGNIVPGIKSINMDYHDGYVYAKIDSKTGKLVSAEFSASADIQASIAIFGDVSVKDIVSTETFTDIVW